MGNTRRCANSNHSKYRSSKRYDEGDDGREERVRIEQARREGESEREREEREEERKTERGEREQKKGKRGERKLSRGGGKEQVSRMQIVSSVQCIALLLLLVEMRGTWLPMSQ